MFVYRLEHPINGLGPYQTYKHEGTLASHVITDLREMSDDHYGDTHPNPMDDGIKGFKKGLFLCGCRSLPELKEWFKGWFTCLKEHGFKVYVVEIEDKWVKQGQKQVVFDPVHILSKTVVR